MVTELIVPIHFIWVKFKLKGPALFYAVFCCRKKALSKNGSSERMRGDRRFCSFLSKQKIPVGKRKMQPWLFWYFFGQAKKYKNRCIATEFETRMLIKCNFNRWGNLLSSNSKNCYCLLDNLFVSIILFSLQGRWAPFLYHN